MAEMTPRELLLTELLSSTIDTHDLSTAVRATLSVVEEDPIATAGRFRGDLLRALMRLGGRYWTAHPDEYSRYRAALRNAALLRRGSGDAATVEFWDRLEKPHRHD